MQTTTAFKQFLLIVIAVLVTTENRLYASDSGSFKTQQQYRQDYEKWIMRAYEGDKDAQFEIGALFTNDQFRKPDYQQAVYWYKKAARQNHVLAQYNLGHQYLTGVGVQKDEKQAMHWWLKAAEQGHALAQFNIGRAYYLGIGLEINIENSKYWFHKAAENNEPKSIAIINKLGWGNENITAPNLSKPIQTKNEEPLTKSLIDRNIINQPVALYTNPEIRSVLIAIQDSSHTVETVNRGKEWTSVRIREGFPVWVHSNFVNPKNNYAEVVGDDVNARSVPIVTKGTEVGKLNSGEKLLIIDSQGDWYRVISPARFMAWIKTKTLDKLPKMQPTKP